MWEQLDLPSARVPLNAAGRPGPGGGGGGGGGSDSGGGGDGGDGCSAVAVVLGIREGSRYPSLHPAAVSMTTLG